MSERSLRDKFQNKDYRDAFVVSALKRGLPVQIRKLRKRREWNQKQLADKSGLTQGVISRAEDPNYGNLTINTILRIASGFDIAFVGRFVAFSELERWFSQWSDESLQVPSFNEDRGWDRPSRASKHDATIGHNEANPGKDWPVVSRSNPNFASQTDAEMRP